MRAKWTNWLLVLSMGVMLAPSVWADSPRSEGQPKAEQEQPQRERPQRDRDGRRRPPPRERSEQRGPGAMDREGMRQMMPLFAALDADRDGTISSEEIENASAALRKLDKNNDGKLDRHELRPHFSGRPGPPPRDRGRARGDRNQSRRDGNRARSDRDRAPRDAERRSRQSGPRRGAPLERLMLLDKNKDGELSAEELAGLPERGKRMLEWADRDNDGALSKTELQAIKKRAEAMRRGRGDREQRGRGQRD